LFEEKLERRLVPVARELLHYSKPGSKNWPRMNADKRESEKDID
jgi:hypothetical protein